MAFRLSNFTLISPINTNLMLKNAVFFKTAFFLFEKFKKFLFNEGGKADSFDHGINEYRRKETDVNIGIGNTGRKGNNECEGDNKHKELCYLRNEHKGKASIARFILLHLTEEMHMGGLRNECISANLCVLTSIYTADGVALSFKMEADGIESLSTVIGDLCFKILLDMGIYLIAVIIEIVGKRDRVEHICLLGFI